VQVLLANPNPAEQAVQFPVEGLQLIQLEGKVQAPQVVLSPLVLN